MATRSDEESDVAAAHEPGPAQEVRSSAGVILATRALPEPSLSTLQPDYQVRVLGYGPNEHELAAEVADVDALITLVSDPVTEAVIRAGRKLRIVANYAVGVNNIDRAAAAARGIVVTNTPGVLTDATADLTLALILALARRVVEGDRMVRAGGFAGWAPDLLLGRELKGKVLGIVGPGRIGRAVARRARAFGMTVIAFARSARADDDPDDPPRVSFDELLRRADVVSLHVPLTDDTRHLFNRETFLKMKPGSLLINTARGGLIDEAALIASLESGQIGGAGLDVYENEPAVLPALLDDDRVVLMPHAGSATTEARREMARMVVEDVRRVLGGERPLRAVSPDPVKR
ncbi:MAG TPA: D-glycerate dehydrogenase [Thermoanaerobaculia bacterium]|nr:D-glycerate dehydrogenase [Thermoanaerobaculia bacterium]